MRTVSKGVTMRRSISCTNSLKFKKLVVFCYFVIYCVGLNYLQRECDWLQTSAPSPPMQTSTFQRGHRPNIHTCGFLSSILCIPGAFAVDRSDHGNELFGIHGFADRVHDLRCAGNVLSRTRVNWQYSLSVILGAHYEICNIWSAFCVVFCLFWRRGCVGASVGVTGTGGSKSRNASCAWRSSSKLRRSVPSSSNNWKICFSCKRFNVGQENVFSNGVQASAIQNVCIWNQPS